MASGVLALAACLITNDLKLTSVDINQWEHNLSNY